ncbi:Hypothetical protein A7982_01344 [Minicystis rosea]|nr:Hypothetical protein A7982_01344 [Minicystis rosea]
MHRYSILLAALCVSCVESAPVVPRLAVPIKSACTAGSRSPASVGIDVRPGRRHSNARTIFVTNTGDRARTVLVQQVARAEGACSGEWARQTSLSFRDAETCEPPEATTIQPERWIQLEVGDQRVAPTWDCTKLGLALWMKVDDELVCADVGASIAERDAEE